MLRELMKDGYGVSITQRKNMQLIPNSFNNNKKILSPKAKKVIRKGNNLSRNSSKDEKNNNKINSERGANLKNNLSPPNLTTAETSNRNQLNLDAVTSSLSNRLYSPEQKHLNNIIDETQNSNINNRNVFSDSKIKNTKNYIVKNNNKSKILEETESNYMDKLHTLEAYISVIKNNGYNVVQNEIENKKRRKEELKSNVDILSSNIRTLNKENKINSNLNNQILKENEILTNSSDKANKDSYYLNKELPNYRIDIDNMKMKISQLNEETKYIRNNSIEYEREIMALQDEVKKLNVLNSNLIKDKEKLIPEIIKYKNSIEMVISKINLIDDQSNHFMSDVEILVKESLKNIKNN
jgi:hypothetical protein